jgi:hypothetical protein
VRWFRSGVSVAGPFVCRCLTRRTLLRFHLPLIEPDRRISRIRLSDRIQAPAHGPPRRADLRRHHQPLPRFPSRESEVLGNMATLLTLPTSTALLKSGSFPPPALPGFVGTTSLSATPRGPACPSRASGWSQGPPLGFPVLRRISLYRHAVAITPVGPQAGSGRSPVACDGGLPRVSDGSAPTSNVSRPARRSLTLRPVCSRGRLAALCIRGFGRIVTFPAAPIATGWSDSCRVGIAPTEDRHLCTAHTDTNYFFVTVHCPASSAGAGRPRR